MIIKINDFCVLTHKIRSLIVSEYFKKYEETKQTNNGLFGSLKSEYTIKETGKYPTIIELGYSRYHVKCRKTRTTIVFDIWLAV
ncbi:hypothetical protein M0Q50_04260 [bacterium]|jgi:hypothetical protein|nr:hypothetical protein [bacterium]